MLPNKYRGQYPRSHGNAFSLKRLRDPEENCRILFRIYSHRIQRDTRWMLWNRIKHCEGTAGCEAETTGGAVTDRRVTQEHSDVTGTGRAARWREWCGEPTGEAFLGGRGKAHTVGHRKWQPQWRSSIWVFCVSKEDSIAYELEAIIKDEIKAKYTGWRGSLCFRQKQERPTLRCIQGKETEPYEFKEILSTRTRKRQFIYELEEHTERFFFPCLLKALCYYLNCLFPRSVSTMGLSRSGIVTRDEWNSLFLEPEHEPSRRKDRRWLLLLTHPRGIDVRSIVSFRSWNSILSF